MTTSILRARAAGVLAAAAAALALTAAPAAHAAPTAPEYTDASYLQRALGLPTSDTDPAIEPVTYDRFQWLLQQPGDHAVLIGDPALDASFAARAQDVEAAAKAAGVEKVYWFDPNLSGSAKVGDVTEPALDIRNPASIPLPAASQAKYGNAWESLVGLYLGDGITATPHDVNEEDATVTIATGTSTINDDGHTAGHSTKVGDADGGALYDYSSGAAPATVLHSFFFIYNKAHTTSGRPAKIVSWTDLTTQAGSASARADVTTAVGTVGAANLEATDEFAWWKDEVDAKQDQQAPNVAQGVNEPVLTGDDDDQGWRVHQVTYPELVDLLRHNTDANAVILFGGTWCPNTRPVLPFVNKYAQREDVKVYNFDTVLDGGLVGGATTSSVNPLQIRNTAAYQATATANPSFLYGDLVSQYLNNVNTQYDYTKGGPAVTYYPKGGDTANALTSVRKLQVPFLVGYRGTPGTAPNGGVSRQWIIKKDDGSYTEYMSQWWYTNPKPNQLGITTIPLGAPIWAKINAALASFTWQSDPSQQYANTASDSDDADFLVDADTATVTYTAASGSTAASVSVSSGGASPVSISPANLASALAAVSPAPANYAAAKAALIDAKSAASPDATRVSDLTTIVGAWGVAQQRKNKVNSVWGTPTAPGSVAGGLAAVHALDVFFAGLPRGVVARRTVSADPVTAGTAPRISVQIANDYGRVPAGTVSLVVRKDGATVTTASAAVAQDRASFTLPALGAGRYDYALSYPDDDQILAFTDTGTLTVSPAPAPATPIAAPAPGATPPATPVRPAATARVKVSKVKSVVVKAPTSRKGGKYTVTLTVPKGAAAASGTVTLRLKKGKATKTLTGTLRKGVVTFTLPKLARGTWKATIAWPGDARYLKASATGVSIKVKK